MDRHLAAVEMRNGAGKRAFPFKAQVAVAGLHWQPRHFGRCKARAVQVELGVAEPVAPSRRPPHQLGPQHVAIEGVRALPVRYVNDAMVELDWQCHEASWSRQVLVAASTGRGKQWSRHVLVPSSAADKRAGSSAIGTDATSKKF